MNNNYDERIIADVAGAARYYTDNFDIIKGLSVNGEDMITDVKSTDGKTHFQFDGDWKDEGQLRKRIEKFTAEYHYQYWDALYADIKNGGLNSGERKDTLLADRVQDFLNKKNEIGSKIIMTKMEIDGLEHSEIIAVNERFEKEFVPFFKGVYENIELISEEIHHQTFLIDYWNSNPDNCKMKEAGAITFDRDKPVKSDSPILCIAFNDEQNERREKFIIDRDDCLDGLGVRTKMNILKYFNTVKKGIENGVSNYLDEMLENSQKELSSLEDEKAKIKARGFIEVDL